MSIWNDVCGILALYCHNSLVDLLGKASPQVCIFITHTCPKERYLDIESIVLISRKWILMFRHCAYPTRGTGKGYYSTHKSNSLWNFNLRLLLAQYSDIFLETYRLRLQLIKKVQECEHYIQKKSVWFHEDLKVFDNFHFNNFNI